MLRKVPLEFSQEDQIALLLASFCHDVDHPGVSNSFLANSKNELAAKCKLLSWHFMDAIVILLP